MFFDGFPLIAIHPTPPLREILTWSTDVRTSHSGKEERIGLREYPRMQLEMDYEIPDDKVNYYHSIILQNYLYWWVPLWHLGLKLDFHANLRAQQLNFIGWDDRITFINEDERYDHGFHWEQHNPYVLLYKGPRIHVTKAVSDNNNPLVLLLTDSPLLPGEVKNEWSWAGWSAVPIHRGQIIRERGFEGTGFDDVLSMIYDIRLPPIPYLYTSYKVVGEDVDYYNNIPSILGSDPIPGFSGADEKDLPGLEVLTISSTGLTDPDDREQEEAIDFQLGGRIIIKDWDRPQTKIGYRRLTWLQANRKYVEYDPQWWRAGGNVGLLGLNQYNWEKHDNDDWKWLAKNRTIKVVPRGPGQPYDQFLSYDWQTFANNIPLDSILEISIALTQYQASSGNFEVIIIPFHRVEDETTAITAGWPSYRWEIPFLTRSGVIDFRRVGNDLQAKVRNIIGDDASDMPQYRLLRIRSYNIVDNHMDFRRFIFRRFGRAMAFILPTFRRDFIRWENFSSQSATLYHNEPESADDSDYPIVKTLEENPFVCVRFKDGTMSAYHTSHIVSLPDTKLINVRFHPLPEIGIADDDIDFICLGAVARLTSDKVEFEWIENTMAECDVSFTVTNSQVDAINEDNTMDLDDSYFYVGDSPIDLKVIPEPPHYLRT